MLSAAFGEYPAIFPWRYRDSHRICHRPEKQKERPVV